MRISNILKWVVPVFALVFVLSGVPAYAQTAECGDSPKTIVYPDCTRISITTCVCEVPDGGGSIDDIVEIKKLTNAGGGTTDFQGNACALDGDDASSAFIDDVTKRGNPGHSPKNATPSPKRDIAIDCNGGGSGCDSDTATTGGDTVDVTVGSYDGKKSAKGQGRVGWGRASYGGYQFPDQPLRLISVRAKQESIEWQPLWRA